MNKVSDADKEAWDILEGKGDGGEGTGNGSSAHQGHTQGGEHEGQASRPSGQARWGKGGGGGGGEPRGRPAGGSGKGGGDGDGGKGKEGDDGGGDWVEECMRVWKKLVKHEKVHPVSSGSPLPCAALSCAALFPLAPRSSSALLLGCLRGVCMTISLLLTRSSKRRWG